MKIALAQTNPWPGEPGKNAQKISEFAQDAPQADLIVYPEYSLAGVLPPEGHLVGSLDQALAFLTAQAGPAKLVGSRDRAETRVWLIESGESRLVARRKLAEPVVVKVLGFRGLRIQLVLGPLPADRLEPADLTIVFDARFFSQASSQVRLEEYSILVKKNQWLVFLNPVGGEGGRVLPGGSLIFKPGGEVFSCRAFDEDLVLLDLTSQEIKRLANDPPADLGLKSRQMEGRDASAKTSLRPKRSESRFEGIFEALVFGVRDYARKSGFSRACLGLSGGIDSALVAVIAWAALGPENLSLVSMPSPYTSPASREDAANLAKALACKFYEIPIEGLMKEFEASLAPNFPEGPPGITEENLQSRIRGSLLMALSNKFGYLVLACGNKSELATGYCTLYGDMNGGLMVLGDLYKSEVYRLARWLNQERDLIPDSIIEKPPSAELRPGQLDSESLPPYRILDGILKLYLEGGLELEEIIRRGYQLETVERVLRLVRRSEFKRRQAPPVIGLGGRSN